jgi:hypothetical protein
MGIMASDNRTLKLSILADVDDLKKKLGEADKAVETNADKITAFGKKAALAFAAAGAAAGAFAISAVKAAAEDEKARKSLEQTIRANTRATDEQIKAIDTYIDRQSIATATTDDVLRPALGRLIRSTNDVAKAQDLLNLSQEISAATGKPLEAVANALGKSFDGQNTALGKLGLGIDAATLKNKSHEEIMQILKGTYKGFIDNEATNAEFKFRQLTIALDQTREKIGFALLPIFVKFADYLLVTVVPNMQAFVAALTGDNSVTAGITDATKGAYEFGEQVRSTIKFVISIKDELLVLGGIIVTVFAVNKIITFATAIMTLVTAMKALRTAAAGAAIATAFATGGTSVGFAAAALAGIAATYGLSKLAAGGDISGAGIDPMGGYQTGANTSSSSMGGAGGFGAGVSSTGTSVGGTGGARGGETTYEKSLSELKKTFDQLKKIGDDQKKVQAQLDIANNIIFANAMPDEDQLRAQRLAAITLEHMRRDDPSSFGVTNNIYVSGAVVDPEGLNRVLTDIQTQSDSRGTLSGAEIRARAG